VREFAHRAPLALQEQAMIRQDQAMAAAIGGTILHGRRSGHARIQHAQRRSDAAMSAGRHPPSAIEEQSMRYRKFGNTGLFVSELCLGTMTFGGGSGGIWDNIGQLRQADADTLIGRSLDAGINFIDTADVYADGQSEIITGQALKNLKVPRENVVVATKIHGETGTKSVNSRGGSRFHIMDGVKASLKRLQLDHVDLYQIHGFDPATPIEETLRALDNLVQHGHVRYIGVSNWAAWQIAKALGISERLGLARFESLQAYYTIAGRDLEREVVPLLNSENVGLLVWSPLAGGLLSGKYTREGGKEEGSRRTKFDFPPVNVERAYDCIDAMRGMAEAKGVSVAQIALAWLLHQKAVTSVIIGAKRVEQLDDNIAATRVRLNEDELAALDEVSQLPAEYPGWMLARVGEYRFKQLREAADY
jgi:aryl-alcohol dehydrogenase-like predicted oxidoreductase